MAADGYCSWSFWRVIQAVLGVVFGYSAFIVFFFVYGNKEAGVWGLISGVFATGALHLALLYRSGRIQEWYSIQELRRIDLLGFMVAVAGFVGLVWYIFYAAYYHIPLMPVDKSAYITAVWAFMTFKWGTLLMHYARRGIAVLPESQPLLESVKQEA